VSDHVRQLLALDAAGALDPHESERVAAHVRDCAACRAEAASWRELAGELGRLAGPRPSIALVARTQAAVELLVAERAERGWITAALGFLVVFAWTLTVVAWWVLDIFTGELALRFQGPVGSTAVWYGAYLVAGWLAAGAAAVLLGRRAQEEGRVV
jgi:predicted anti-sigma-YlaC factor YlaD